MRFILEQVLWVQDSWADNVSYIRCCFDAAMDAVHQGVLTRFHDDMDFLWSKVAKCMCTPLTAFETRFPRFTR